MHRSTKTVIPGELPLTSEMFETQELFPQAYFTHTPMYAYLPMFMSYWNMQEYLDLNVFWAGDSRLCGHFAFLRHAIKFAFFRIAHLNCIFQGASFALITNLASLPSDSPKCTRVFTEPSIPLLHPSNQLD